MYSVITRFHYMLRHGSFGFGTPFYGTDYSGNCFNHHLDSNLASGVKPKHPTRRWNVKCYTHSVPCAIKTEPVNYGYKIFLKIKVERNDKKQPKWRKGQFFSIREQNHIYLNLLTKSTHIWCVVLRDLTRGDMSVEDWQLTAVRSSWLQPTYTQTHNESSTSPQGLLGTTE